MRKVKFVSMFVLLALLVSVLPGAVLAVGPTPPQARTTADLERRQQLVLDAQRIVLEQAIWQPLLVRRITFAVDSTCVHGEQQSSAGALLFYDAQTAP